MERPKQAYSEPEVIKMVSAAYKRGQSDMQQRCIGVMHSDHIDILNRLMNVFTDHADNGRAKMPLLEIEELAVKKREGIAFEDFVPVSEETP